MINFEFSYLFINFTLMEKIERLVICGIYSIKNKVNSKCYIGQSHNIYMRLGMHLTRLANNKHKNRLLQEEWNVHGSDNFEFEILEECEIEDLEYREMYYINNFADYNIQRDGFRLRMTDYSRQKMSKSRQEGLQNGTIIVKTKSIHKYDLEGNYIESYGSVRQASNENNILNSCIVRAASRNKSAGGFMWNYKAKDKIQPYKAMRGFRNKDLLKSGEFMETPEVDNHELNADLNVQ